MSSPCIIFGFVNKIEDCLECVKVSNRLSPRAARAAHSDYYHGDLTSEKIKNTILFNLGRYILSFDIHLVQSHIKMLSLMLLIVVIFNVSTILKSISLCAQCKKPTLIEQINTL